MGPALLFEPQPGVKRVFGALWICHCFGSQSVNDSLAGLVQISSNLKNNLRYLFPPHDLKNPGLSSRVSQSIRSNSSIGSLNKSIERITTTISTACPGYHPLLLHLFHHLKTLSDSSYHSHPGWREPCPATKESRELSTSPQPAQVYA